MERVTLIIVGASGIGDETDCYLSVSVLVLADT